MGDHIRSGLTTASGRFIDLLNPKPEDIDFHDIAEHLAKENRFNGATPGLSYSVAQHLVLGTTAVYLTTGNRLMAGYFVLHDAHEAYLKDDTTPKKRALDRIAEQRFGVLAGAIGKAFAELTDRWDRAIHAAAGLAWPMPPDIGAVVHRFDRNMLLTEWRDLMPANTANDARILPDVDHQALPDRIEPWAWQEARVQLGLAFRSWLPRMGAEAAA